MELDAKKKRITQKAIVENTVANDWITFSFFTFVSVFREAGAAEPWPDFSYRRNVRRRA